MAFWLFHIRASACTQRTHSAQIMYREYSTHDGMSTAQLSNPTCTHALGFAPIIIPTQKRSTRPPSTPNHSPSLSTPAFYPTQMAPGSRKPSLALTGIAYVRYARPYNCRCRRRRRRPTIRSKSARAYVNVMRAAATSAPAAAAQPSPLLLCWWRRRRTNTHTYTHTHFVEGWLLGWLADGSVVMEDLACCRTVC